MSQASLRQRRRRRLAIIGGVLVLLVGLVLGRYLMVGGNPSTPEADPQVQQAQQRDVGLAAFAAGDDAAALVELTPLASGETEDVEVLYALGMIHQRRSKDDIDHLLSAASLLRKATSLDPDHEPATRALLQIMVDHPTNVEQEMLRLSERLLRSNADDALGLRAQIMAYGRLQRHDDALAAADRYLVSQPLDVAILRQRLDLLKAKGFLPDALMDETRKLREAHPDAAEPLLAEAYARLITDDSEASVGWLDRATRTPPPNRDFVTQTVEIYDSNRRYDLTLQYLDALQAANDPHVPEWELALRRFEAGQFDRAAELIASLEDPPLSLRSVQVLALLRQGDRAAAGRLLEQLEKNQTDEATRPGVAAVVQFLRLCVSTDTTAAQVIAGDEALREAGVRNPYLDFVVGQAYAAQDQLAEARSRYEKALKVRPVWAAPGLELARILRQQGEPELAARYAYAATQRQRTSLNNQVELALSLGAEPGDLTNPQKNQLLQLIDNIQQAAPGEPRTLALRVDVLASTGDRADANATAREVLKSDPPPTEPQMLELIELADRHDLPVRDELREAYAQQFGQTLRLTMQQVNDLLAEGDFEAALAHYDAARPETPSAEWDVNRVLILEKTGRADEARAAWSSVARAYPQEPRVQQALLQSNLTWQDRQLIQQTVSRLREIDESAAPWRMSQARLWLEAPKASERAEETLALLEDVPVTAEVRLMQALAHDNLGSDDAALAALRDAIDLNPTYTAAQLLMVEVLARQSDEAAALEVARTLSARQNLNTEQRRRVATWLVRLGDSERAMGSLETLAQQDQLGSTDALLLAQLYRRAGRDRDALDLSDRILEQASAPAIAFIADLQARLGDDAAAGRTLARLDTAEVPADEARTVRAAHEAVHGDADQAQATFRKLVDADPTRADAWTNLIGFMLRRGDMAGAVNAAREAGASLPDHQGLAAVRSHASELQALANTPEANVAQGLALTLLYDETNRAAAGTTLEQLNRMLQLDVGDAERRRSRAEAILKLADQHTDYELLQRLAVSAYLETGRTQAALEAAQRTMQRFPDSAPAAQIAAEAWSSVGRWREAVVAAEAWSDRLSGDRSTADAMVARLHRLLGRPNVALQRLTPYRSLWSDAAADPTDAGGSPLRQTLLQEYILSLSAAGRTDEAWNLLAPRLSSGRVWRMTALEAAAGSVSNAATAAAWLDRVGQALPPLPDATTDEAAVSAVQERALLAQGYLSLGRRESRPELIDKAQQLVTPLTQRPDADASMWFLLGTVEETRQDLPAAEQAYRKAVELEPDAVTPRNNLAMVLAQRGESLDEAAELIGKALELSAPSPNLLDTQAFVLLKAGRYEEAAAAARQAMQLEPANPAWARRLNQIQAESQAQQQSAAPATP